MGCPRSTAPRSHEKAATTAPTTHQPGLVCLFNHDKQQEPSMKRDCNPSGPRKGRPFPSRLRPAVIALLALGGSASAGLAVAQTSDADSAEKTFTLGGYVRAWASMNLQDQPETKGDDKHKVSMLRGSILLDADYKPTSSLRFKAIARMDLRHRRRRQRGRFEELLRQR
jgi:hypothetical protein